VGSICVFNAGYFVPKQAREERARECIRNT